MTNHSKPGKNERQFAKLVLELAPQIELLGKVKRTQGNISISVDQSIIHNGTNYWIEIDSGNIPKLLVGQYVLLNQLKKENDYPVFFLVVHTYKSYDPERTLKNLRLVNDQLYSGRGIPFGAIHISDLKSWTGDIIDFLCKHQVSVQAI